MPRTLLTNQHTKTLRSASTAGKAVGRENRRLADGVICDRSAASGMRVLRIPGIGAEAPWLSRRFAGVATSCPANPILALLDRLPPPQRRAIGCRVSA